MPLAASCEVAHHIACACARIVGHGPDQSASVAQIQHQTRRSNLLFDLANHNHVELIESALLVSANKVKLSAFGGRIKNLHTAMVGFYTI